MEVISLKQFAERQGVSMSTARRWVQQGLPCAKATKYGKCLIDAKKARMWVSKLKQKPSPDCLSIQQTADFAGVHRNTVRNWMRSNEEFRESVVIAGKASYMISSKTGNLARCA